MNNKRLKFVVGLLFGLFILTSFVSAYSQFYYPSSHVSTGGFGAFTGSRSLMVDERMCQEGTDFLIQIDPLGCTPSVVRSDLLEEENVRVHCQLRGTQINPFVDVDMIDWISFSDERPPEVLGVGYTPAKAALGYDLKNSLENSADLNNLGYVTFTLKRQPNESALQNCEKTMLGGEVCWVEGNLTARITYDLKNVFGVGNAIFYLPTLDDEEWEDDYVQYGFWEGRGYLRAENVEDNQASISIYSDDSVAQSLSRRERVYTLSKYASDIGLNVGETSNRIFLPGLSPCLAGLQITLAGVEDPQTRAMIKVNEDYVEVGYGEKFLDNACEIVGLNKAGINSDVDIVCRGDKRESFSLGIFPKVNLSIDGQKKVYEVGDWLFKSEDGEKSIYLGYVGTFKDTTNKEDLYTSLVALPVHKNKLTSDEIDSVATFAETANSNSDTGALIYDEAINYLKKVSSKFVSIGKWAIKGEEISFVAYGIPVKDFGGKEIELKGFAEAQENEFLSTTTEEYDLEEEVALEKYYFEDKKIEESKIVLLKRKGFEIPSFSILVESNEGTSDVVGILYGKNCSDSICEKYSLSLDNFDFSINSFFADVVGIDLNLEEKILSIERISYEESGEEDYQKDYRNAREDFETVIDSFASEKESQNSVRTLGEEALHQEILLAESVGQKKTMVELCETFKKDYPNAETFPDVCNGELKIASSEISVREVVINGITKRISFEGIKEPSKEDYGAKLNVRGPNGYTKNIDLRKDKKVFLTGFRDEKIEDSEYILLNSLDENSAEIKLFLRDQSNLEKYVLSNNKNLKKGEDFPEGGYVFTLLETNVNQVAKVKVISREEFAQSENDFKFKIGIEKRNTLFKLSPERTQERIDLLNNSIESWQKASDALYTVVKTMKASCIGAGAVLTFKNFISNYGGKSIARQNVMSGTGGWNEECTQLVSEGQYDSMDSCFLGNSEAIENEVNKLYNIMQIQDEKIKEFAKINTIKGEGKAQDYVNDTGFIEDYSAQVRQTLSSLSENEKGNLDVEKINEILTLDGWENGQYTQEQLKEIELYALHLKSSGNDEFTTKRLYSVLSDVEVNSEKYLAANTFEEETGMGGNSLVDSLGKGIKMKQIQVSNRIKFEDTKYASMNVKDSDGISPSPEYYSYALLDSSTGNKYIILYEENGVVKQTYEIVSVGSVESLQIYKDNKDKAVDNPFDLYFKKYDKASYENKYKSSYGESSVLLRYYETSPFKGFPSVVPFDLEKGWYAGVKTPQTAYDASGVVKSFWICNVAENGIEEFQLENFGDDICQLFNLNTGQQYTNFPGLNEDESYALVKRANDAIQSAQNSYREGVNFVNGIRVGAPSLQTLAVQCTDFMSATDCSLLFNLCDPVICPSSRCNLGGNYPVQNVIQSGIIGSIALCYPNAKWNGGDVYVPVCLTGIYAGLDSWVSIQKSYRDCLQTSLDTGETVGICDEINSIYVCEFFWKQAIPIIDSALPRLIGAITGQGKKGGGEYQGLSSAMDTASDSIDYFKQYYAAESYRAFKVRSTEEAGTEICSAFASLTYPDGGSFLDNLIEPDSPIQFTAKFDEIPLTTITNPPTSHYKVYYHIYAGKDTGAYYTVYLRGSGSSYYQDTAQRRIVNSNSNYIPRGEYVSETVDFTAPSGYNELCVVVNGQEECGFKEVTTSFALNYIEDMYLASQVTETNITTEEECKSGTASLYSLLNLNLQSAAENLIDPAIYSQGIIRICSTDDPGKGTNAAAGTEDARWKQVGYCGNNRVGCWIDTESVRDVIKTKNIEEDALDEVGKDYVDYLSEEYLTEAMFEDKIEEIGSVSEAGERLEIIQSIFDKVFYSNQKARLFFLRGKTYSEIAIAEYNFFIENNVRIKTLLETKRAREAAESQETGEGGPICGNNIVEEGEECDDSNTVSEDGCSSVCELEKRLVDQVTFGKDYISPLLEFEDGTSSPNACYKFFNGEWFWTPVCEYATTGIDLLRVGDFANSEKEKMGSTEKTIEFVNSLKDKDYLQGFKLLLVRTRANDEGGWFFNTGLSTGSISMSHEGIFNVDFTWIATTPIDYRYLNQAWQWSPDEKNWMETNTLIVHGGKYDKQSPSEENKKLIYSLKDETGFYEGAAIIFNVDAKEEVTGLDSCNTRSECQKILGGDLIDIAKDIRIERNNLNYSTVKSEGLANSFECLILQQAWIESKVQHCKKVQSENNPLYCNGDKNNLISGTDAPSLGIMQINLDAHPNGAPSIYNFEGNVKYGVNLLLDNFENFGEKSRNYGCGDKKTYTGWAAALRGYNGWNTNCNKGDVYYVEKVVDVKNDKSFKTIFPECA